jgi:hypothetical protein
LWNLSTQGAAAGQGHPIALGWIIPAFQASYFASSSAVHWKGEIELRGLQSVKYRVFGYVDDKDLGTIDGKNPKLNVEFFDHLLLEVSRL